MPKQKVFKLEFEPEILIFGILTHKIPLYQWIFLLNRYLGMAFVRKENIELQKGNDWFRFLRFTYSNRQNQKFHIISSRSFEENYSTNELNLFNQISSQQFLGPKFKKYDCIFIEETENQYSELENRLKMFNFTLQLEPLSINGFTKTEKATLGYL